MAEDWARPVVHWEIQAADSDKIANFYEGLFNWDIGQGRVRNIGATIGAPEPITGHILQTGHSAVVPYIQVLNLADSVAKCRELGGEVLREPFASPTGAGLAWIADPEGNRVVLVQQ
jgi:predicted enzyme related to lactoylglutathione lyase